MVVCPPFSLLRSSMQNFVGDDYKKKQGSFHFDVGIDVDVDENFVDVDIDDHLMAGPTRQFLQQVSFVCFSDC